MTQPKYAIGDTLRHVAKPRCRLFEVVKQWEEMEKDNG